MRSRIKKKFDSKKGVRAKEFITMAEDAVLNQRFANTIEGQVLMPSPPTKAKKNEAEDLNGQSVSKGGSASKRNSLKNTEEVEEIEEEKAK